MNEWLVRVRTDINLRCTYPFTKEGSVSYLYQDGVSIPSVLVDAKEVTLLEEDDGREAEQHEHNWKGDEVAHLKEANIVTLC